MRSEKHDGANDVYVANPNNKTVRRMPQGEQVKLDELRAVTVLLQQRHNRRSLMPIYDGLPVTWRRPRHTRRLRTTGRSKLVDTAMHCCMKWNEDGRRVTWRGN